MRLMRLSCWREREMSDIVVLVGEEAFAKNMHARTSFRLAKAQHNAEDRAGFRDSGINNPRTPPPRGAKRRRGPHTIQDHTEPELSPSGSRDWDRSRSLAYRMTSDEPAPINPKGQNVTHRWLGRPFE